MDQNNNVTPITSARRPLKPDPTIPPYDPFDPSHRDLFELGWRLVHDYLRKMEREADAEQSTKGN